MVALAFLSASTRTRSGAVRPQEGIPVSSPAQDPTHPIRGGSPSEVSLREENGIPHLFPSGCRISISRANPGVVSRGAIRLEEVAAATAKSRRALERLFAATLNLSPHNHLKNLRLEKIGHLIAATDESLDASDRAVRLTGGRHLRVFFRTMTDERPSEFVRRPRHVSIARSGPSELECVTRALLPGKYLLFER